MTRRRAFLGGAAALFAVGGGCLSGLPGSDDVSTPTPRPRTVDLVSVSSIVDDPYRLRLTVAREGETVRRDTLSLEPNQPRFVAYRRDQPEPPNYGGWTVEAELLETGEIETIPVDRVGLADRTVEILFDVQEGPDVHPLIARERPSTERG